MKTLLDYYKFFESIPEEKWCNYKLLNDKGQCCARGHLGTRLLAGRIIESPEAIKFYELTNSSFMVVSLINDGKHYGFNQPTPKARILAFIKSKL